jgi:hypothetical protein
MLNDGIKEKKSMKKKDIKKQFESTRVNLLNS